MVRHLAAIAGLVAICAFSLGCGRESQPQPSGANAPPQASSPEQTMSPTPPPPPAVPEAAMGSQPEAPPSSPPATDSGTDETKAGQPSSSSDNAASDDDDSIRPGRIAKALLRAAGAAIPIPRQLGIGTRDVNPRGGEEAPPFRP